MNMRALIVQKLLFCDLIKLDFVQWTRAKFQRNEKRPAGLRRSVLDLEYQERCNQLLQVPAVATPVGFPLNQGKRTVIYLCFVRLPGFVGV